MSFAWVEAVFAQAAGRPSHLCLFAGGRRAEIARAELRAMLAVELRRELASACPPDDLSARVAMTTGSLLSLLEWWLADGARRPPAEIAGLFRQSVSLGLAP
jgi:hypothetical protein